ncbi:hypothetical protein BYT27DRAFT_7184495 [Phlegmacium glaucopus]|nr:hypothetical protein BYT27DRAFT_7184495 [Phlegmacium glaucopus]
MSISLLITLALAATALAAPRHYNAVQHCDISKVQLSLPPNRTAFSTPTSPLSFLMLGVGVQNYTCSTAGTYTSAGAVASLYDLSCISQSPIFDDVQDMAYMLWKASPENGHPPEVASFMGSHFFITSPSGTGISPVWDFRAGAAKGNPNAYVLAAKIADVPAPTGPQDVDWLQLKSVSGSLATQIYRTDTREGSAPTSCTPGSAPISLRYVAKYWLYGGNVTV